MTTNQYSEFGTVEKEGWSDTNTAQSYAASLEACVIGICSTVFQHQ